MSETVDVDHDLDGDLSINGIKVQSCQICVSNLNESI
jgi:hypothetical protein